MIFERSNIPGFLKQLDLWVCWRLTEDGKKLPISAVTGKSKDWQLHSTRFDVASRYADEHRIGIGISFHNQNRIWGMDLDGCRAPTTGHIEPWAKTIVETARSYCEVSPSGTGLKIIAAGYCDMHLSSICYGDVLHGNHIQQVEFKTSSGYFTITGMLYVR